MHDFFFGGSLVNPPLIFDLVTIGVAFLIGVPLSLIMTWVRSRG